LRPKSRSGNRINYFEKPVNEGNYIQSNKFVGVTLPFNNPKGIFFQSKTNIKQLFSNVRNLLLTTRGERYMLPDFGTNLKNILFENITSEDQFLENIKTDIVESLNTWMPFLTIEKLTVNVNPDTSDLAENDHAIKIDLTLKLRETTIYLPIRLFISTIGRIEIAAIEPR
jgi:phage baseplate assembly protein W